jgi:nicotinamidase-related amidase
MVEIKLDKSKTMLLMADLSTTGIGQNPIAEERQTLERAREVSDRNKTRAARKDSGEVLPADPAALIHPPVLPGEGKPVIAKHCTSAFSGSAFEMILRAQNIDTLILMGHATSGVILFTVRLAANLDYQLIVAEDGCTDRDPEVHKLLMEKVFPRQAR